MLCNQSPSIEQCPHLISILEVELDMLKCNLIRRSLVVGNAPLAISKDAETGISIEFLRISTKQETGVKA
jgi:hypothetical protein